MSTVIATATAAAAAAAAPATAAVIAAGRALFVRPQLTLVNIPSMVKFYLEHEVRCHSNWVFWDLFLMICRPIVICHADGSETRTCTFSSKLLYNFDVPDTQHEVTWMLRTLHLIYFFWLAVDNNSRDAMESARRDGELQMVRALRAIVARGEDYDLDQLTPEELKAALNELCPRLSEYAELVRDIYTPTKQAVLAAADEPAPAAPVVAKSDDKKPVKSSAKPVGRKMPSQRT